MKSTLTLIAMAAATAQASVVDDVVAAATAHGTRRELVGRMTADSPAPAAEDNTHLKGKCLKGYATTGLAATVGWDLFVPTDGYCMNDSPDSLLLTCAGTCWFLFYYSIINTIPRVIV